MGSLGNDCSGAMCWVFRMAGVPVPRTTALAMWNGAWPGERTTVKEGARELSQFPDLMFFDFTIGRPRGHVGLIRWNVMLKNQRNVMMAEASSSKNRFKETLILPNDSRWRATHGVLTPNLKMEAGGRR
jgi:cell wall-associated NlpC family hydrolase